MLAELQAHSLTHRIASGPHRGCKAFTLQTLPPTETIDSSLLARAGDFSLHAGLLIEADQREKLEHLCRDIARLPLARERLCLTSVGTIRYRLKIPGKTAPPSFFSNPWISSPDWPYSCLRALHLSPSSSTCERQRLAHPSQGPPVRSAN